MALWRLQVPQGRRAPPAAMTWDTTYPPPGSLQPAYPLSTVELRKLWNQSSATGPAVIAVGGH